MTQIFIFAHFGLNVYHSLYFVALERLCLYNREISLAALLRQNSKTNMTKNRDKIVILKKKSWYYIFAISLTPSLNLWPLQIGVNLNKYASSHTPFFESWEE